jgi:hypothetical protein
MFGKDWKLMVSQKICTLAEARKRSEADHMVGEYLK